MISDLPFVPQAFYIPAGSKNSFSLTGTTAANNNTGSISLRLTGDGKGESSYTADVAILKLTSFQVT